MRAAGGERLSLKRSTFTRWSNSRSGRSRRERHPEPHPCIPGPRSCMSVLTCPEAEREGWLGEAEGLQVSLAGAEEKLRQLDRGHGQHTAVDLGIPTTRDDR
ncbi:hypothetical protein GCM10010376_92600 [Streptomyces violaceusniger]